jgi:hypothetical protein
VNPKPIIPMAYGRPIVEVEAEREAEAKAANVAAFDPEPMHTWFGLTYSAYLVLNRSALEAMPAEWQARMVALLEEMREHLDADQLCSEFKVMATKNGKFVTDPWRDYRRGPAVPLRKRSP